MEKTFKNTLLISGKEVDLDSFDLNCKGFDLLSSRFPDEYTKKMMRFQKNKLIELYNKYEPNEYEDDIRGMVLEKIGFEIHQAMLETFPPRTMEEFQIAIRKEKKKCSNRGPYFCFNKLYPEPKGTMDSVDIYNWRKVHWGCSVLYIEKYTEHKNYMKIELLSKHGHIQPWIMKVSADFPSLTFKHEWNNGYGGVADSSWNIIVNNEIIY